MGQALSTEHVGHVTERVAKRVPRGGLGERTGAHSGHVSAP